MRAGSSKRRARGRKRPARDTRAVRADQSAPVPTNRRPERPRSEREPGARHTRCSSGGTMANVIVDDQIVDAEAGERLVDLLNRRGIAVPQVCYHRKLGPIQTCDTCLVEVDGALVRACATQADGAKVVSTASPRVKVAQRAAFDRILGNHQLYCTVCDNNNGNCTVHNTTKLLQIEHQDTPFRPKPYDVDHTNPFYRYDPSQCILCGRCVEACQDVQVNETRSIRWEDPHPRVLWDGGAPIGESGSVSGRH